MKLFRTSLLSLFILLTAFPAMAEGPISIHLYKADPTAKDGFTETDKWRMNESDEWRRFEYLATKAKPGDKGKISPFINHPAEMLVLSIKDANGITGKDYYLTADGITIITIAAKSDYYEDANDFFKLLKEQVVKQTSFEKYPGEKVSNDADGIVIRYLINRDLPNPAWKINTQENVNLYDSFMRKIPAVGDTAFQYDNPFDKKGNFILLLNYPKAPGKYATVGPEGIRISTTENIDSYIKDDKKYYQYFYDLTKDSMRMKFDVQKREDAQKARGNF